MANYIENYEGATVIVSHDHYSLDEPTNHLDIDKLFNTTYFLKDKTL